jgi:DNA-binding ferritin-like protein (Dps family)
MKSIAILPLALLFLSTGVVKSQAPVTDTDVAASLQSMIGSNKTLIDKQQKTLDALDALDQAAQDLKTFAKRS